MMTPSTEPEATPGRRRSRAACEECRRRKLRCDGLQPKCGVCQASGLVCEVTSRDVRGPKKGHLKALKNRILELETMLRSREGVHQQQAQEQDGPVTGDNVVSTLSAEVPNSLAVGPYQPWLPTEHSASSDVEIPLSNSSLSDLGNLPGWSLASTVPLSNTQTYLTDVIKAELDQLYMDRVHPSIPILHQRRYLSWSKSSTKTPARTCLQYAMWTLAALLSAQFRDMIDVMYNETKQMLESLTFEVSGKSSCDTELVQAWVLTVICESMRTHHRQAWMSVGRVFRLVQALRFHEIDSPKNEAVIPSADSNDSIGTEEKRRVFWMAYFLDHLFSMRNDWPVTLNEHVICTRLPMPDTEFQGGHCITGAFLSEAITDSSSQLRSPFNECLILATISGRSMLRSQQSKISKAFGANASEWEEQRHWLDTILTHRLQILSESYPSPTETNDPFLLFAHVLGQATVVHYCKGIIESVRSDSDQLGSDPEVLESQHRASKASAAIVYLAKELRGLHYSKIHPLMPIPLFISGEFLYDNRFRQQSFMLCLRELVEIFRELADVNNHGQSYMDLLSRSCISKSTELVNNRVI